MRAKLLVVVSLLSVGLFAAATPRVGFNCTTCYNESLAKADAAYASCMRGGGSTGLCEEVWWYEYQYYCTNNCSPCHFCTVSEEEREQMTVEIKERWMKNTESAVAQQGGSFPCTRSNPPAWCFPTTTTVGQ